MEANFQTSVAERVPVDTAVTRDEPMAEQPEQRVPVTILTGFLGAGKTTLLKHVLGAKHGLKIAVIQNELSATTGLEAATMRGPNGEWFDKWMELSNGCVCCEVREELPFAIERLMEAKGRFDHVIIETTGMADPGPVAASLWLDDELESALRLDGIVTLVDAQHAARHLDTVESCRQIASADVLILNKVDAATDAAVATLESQLRTINLLAPIHRTSQSAVPLTTIFNLQAYAREEGVRALAPKKHVANPSVAAATGGGAELTRADGAGSVATDTTGGTGADAEDTAGGNGVAAASERFERAAAGLCACCLEPVCGACEAPGAALDGAVADGASADGTIAVKGAADGAMVGGATRYLHRDGRFGSVTLLLGAAPLRLDAVQAYLAALFWEGEMGGACDGAGAGEKPEVYRAKGLVAIAPDEDAVVATAPGEQAQSGGGVSGGDVSSGGGSGGAGGSGGPAPLLRYTLQAVHETWELTEAPAWAEGEVAESRFVFIGRNLDEAVLRKALEACRVP